MTAVGIIGGLWYPARPWADALEVDFVVQSKAAYADLFKTVVPALDPTRGHVFVSASDCANLPAPDVSYSLDPPDPSATGFYGVGEVDQGTATIPGNSFGGFLNVEPGARNLVVTRRKTLECVARVPIVVHEGKETQVLSIVPHASNNCGPD